MNIMFFLKPKSDLAYIYDYHTLRQAKSSGELIRKEPHLHMNWKTEMTMYRQRPRC